MTLSQNARVRLGTLAWTALITLFAAGAPLIWSASPLVFISAAGLGAAVGVLSVLIVRTVRGKDWRGTRWLRSSLAGACLAIGAVAAPIYWVVLQTALLRTPLERASRRL